MAIDLPHPWPLPLGWQSARPVGFWVNKHFLLSWQSGVEIESSKKAWKNISIGLSCAADRTIETCLSFMDGLTMIVSLLALACESRYMPWGIRGDIYKSKHWLRLHKRSKGRFC